MSITAEREEVIDFSQNYIPPASSAYLAATADVDLKSGPVAAQTGTIQAGYVAEQGMTLVEYATPEETIAAVKNGEAVAVFADKDYLVPMAAESNGELVMLANEVALGGGVGLGFRDSDDELRGKTAEFRARLEQGADLDDLLEEAFAVVRDPASLPDEAARMKLEGEIMKVVDGQLGAVARPARVRFVTVLPKTRSGKLLRRAIQAVCEKRDPGDLTTIEDPTALQQIKDLVS